MNQQELSHELRKEAIKNGHAVQMKASGYSMFPFLRKGDILTVEPIPMNKIKRGDVVVFEMEEKWIAHRVIKIRNREKGLEFLLRGDTCAGIDPPVNKENFIGAVYEYHRQSKQKKTTRVSRKLWTKLIQISFTTYPLVARILLRIHQFYLIQLKGLK